MVLVLEGVIVTGGVAGGQATCPDGIMANLKPALESGSTMGEEVTRVRTLKCWNVEGSSPHSMPDDRDAENRR
jgi:hypothetical protein